MQSSRHFIRKFQALILTGVAGVLLLAAGCGGDISHSPPPEIKAFFLAGQEARLLGMKQTLSLEKIDLSAYAHLMDIRYPPTSQVDILKGPPTRSYVVFAVLRGPKPAGVDCDAPSVTDSFVAKARTIGADGIIVCLSPNGSGIHQVLIMEALAVKYRQLP